MPEPVKWWLSKDCANDTQALLAGALKELKAARGVLLHLPDGAGGGWITRLREIAPITPASEKREGQDRAATLAFTAAGLRKSGLPKAILNDFSAPFLEGMTQPDRARRLGDTLDSDEAEGTIVQGGLLWSGDAAPPRQGKASDIRAPGHRQIDAILMLYAKTADDLEDWCDAIGAALGPLGVTFAHEIQLTTLPDERTPMREHFGFVDGISQPVPCDHPQEARKAIEHITEGEALERAKAVHQIWSGDILFGRHDAYGERAGGPFLAADADAHDRLEQGAAPIGSRDLGWNGSFLVVRQMRQDVARFWRNMDAIEAQTGVKATWVAERIIGRTLDGGLLACNAAVEDNDVGFNELDEYGLGCPLGAHIRRGNPRDAGARAADDRPARLKAVNNHRVLRRGRTYGPRPPEDKRADDGQQRGLLFMCFNTDLARQFEFIMQTWLNNQHFASLAQADPLLSPKGKFSIQGAPVRRKIEVETFVRLVGGAYFFLPSLRALGFLEHCRAAVEQPDDAASTVMAQDALPQSNRELAGRSDLAASGRATTGAEPVEALGDAG